MRCIKAKDVILVVGYESVIAELVSNNEVDEPSDMSSGRSIIWASNIKYPKNLSEGWGIDTTDLHLVKQCPVSTKGMLTRETAKKIEKKGYHWEIRLSTIKPRRSYKR